MMLRGSNGSVHRCELCTPECAVLYVRGVARTQALANELSQRDGELRGAHGNVDALKRELTAVRELAEV